MKTTYTKRALALLLSLVVMLSMCLAGTVSAFAASEGATRFTVESTGTVEDGTEDAMSMNAPLSDGTQVTTVIPPTTGKFSQFYYLQGPGDNSTVMTFKVAVPTKGRLTLEIGDPNGSYSVNMRTNGFGDYEYVSSSDVRRVIGVKKGIYTFRVKSYASVIAYRVKFNKVKESKYGLKKSTAVKIKKKSLRKGLIVANDHKSHYYKFYNPKLQKVKVVITTSLNSGTTASLNGGGKYGGIKVTFYDKRGSIGSAIINPSTPSTTFELKTLGKNNRLVRGTYKIKIQSYKYGNGYFTVKWK